MIVAAESNFVLELALRQEQASDADQILEFAERSKIKLVFPACALFEPYGTLDKRRNERNLMQERLANELSRLARLEAFPDLLETSKSVTRALAGGGEAEAKSLGNTIQRIVRSCVIVPLTSEIVRSAADIESKFQLRPQDAVVFASIDQFLREQGKGPKLFANKNTRDFGTPEIEAHFHKYECRLLGTFHGAVEYIKGK